jgi:hypothetical protein
MSCIVVNNQPLNQPTPDIHRKTAASNPSLSHPRHNQQDTRVKMDKSLVSVQEISDAERDSRPTSTASSRQNSSSTHSHPSSARHSCEAPTSPFCSVHNNPTNNTNTSSNDDVEGPQNGDAPPPYRKLNVDEERQMRMRDYATWLSRTMGKQLVKGLKGKEGEDVVAGS